MLQALGHAGPSGSDGVGRETEDANAGTIGSPKWSD